MAATKQEAEDLEIKVGKALKLTEELINRSSSETAEVQAQVEKISDVIVELTKKGNDFELARQKDEKSFKEMEDKQEKMERLLSRSNSPTFEKNEMSLDQDQLQVVSRYLTSDLNMRMALTPEIADINKQNMRELVRSYYPNIQGNKFERLLNRFWVEGDNTKGGYLVRPEISRRFIERDLNSASMRPWVTIEPMSTAQKLINIDDDISIRAQWTGELESPAVQATAEIGQASMVAKEMFANVPASHEWLEDTTEVDVESWIARKLDKRFLLTENDAVINGTGAKELKGILQYDDWSAPGVYTRDAVERIPSETANVIAYNDIANMVGELPGIYRPDAAWFMSRSAMRDLTKIISLDGFPLLKPGDGFREGFRGTLLFGYPVIIMDQLPRWLPTAPVPTADEPIIFGDFKASITIGDRLGMSIVRDMVTDPSVVKFLARRRMGLIVTAYDGMKILKIS